VRITNQHSTCWNINKQIAGVTVVLNIRVPREIKTDYMKQRLCTELESVFHKFPKYHTKMLLGDSNAKADREDIFKPTIGNESLHEISNDTEARVNFDTLKNHNVKSTMLLHCNITTLLVYLLTERTTISLTAF
jgi:hypothetical protein